MTRHLVWGALLCAALIGPAAAEAPLRVGVIDAPPFAMRGEAGAWEGIAVDLFAAVAEPLGLRYELVETTAATVIEDVAAGRLDAAVGPVAMTADREKIIDFSHSFFHGGLGVAEPKVRRADPRAILHALETRNMAGTILVLTVLLLVVGLLVWLLERRHNSGQFERRPAKGVFSGFYWASVTMTGVGYGDKAPITFAGRLLAIVWMFVALILIALVTAQLSAVLTADRIATRLNTIADLAHIRVGTVTGAGSFNALRVVGVRAVGYPDVVSGLTALSDNEIDAFVYDEAILLWSLGTVEGVTMAPLRLGSEDLAFVLPLNSPLREPVNQSLLRVMASDQWTVILRLYLGIDP